MLTTREPAERFNYANGDLS